MGNKIPDVFHAAFAPGYEVLFLTESEIKSSEPEFIEFKHAQNSENSLILKILVQMILPYQTFQPNR